MAIDVFVRRYLADGRQWLMPADALSEKALADLPGPRWKTLRAKITVERSGPRNRFAHALFAKTAEALSDPRWTAEGVKTALKIRCGLVDMLHVGGRDVEIPRSVAFDKMDEAEFAAFVDRAVHVIATELLPGISPSDLRREIEDMIDA